MAKRYTRKDAKGCLERFAGSAGRRVAISYGDVGGWQVDCNTHYGGCVIEEISNTGGGVSRPFGNRRVPPREFCRMLDFGSDAIAVAKEPGHQFRGAKRKRRRR